MTVVTLGKAVKAMYKLSGKTLTQLSEETDLSIDTLNNFFYARLQKPSFLGVSKLVEATGYTMNNLAGFLEVADTLPENADYCEEFAKYIICSDSHDTSVIATIGSSAESTTASANATTLMSADADSTVMLSPNAAVLKAQLDALSEAHEKELDRFKATHLRYVEELNLRHREQVDQIELQNNEYLEALKTTHDSQINQMENSFARLKEHYDHSVGEIKKTQAEELARIEKECSRARFFNYLLGGLLAIVIIALLLFKI